MNFTGFHGVNSGGIHATVTEDIRKAHDVLLQGIIGSCEQVPEVMGKTFFSDTPASLHIFFISLHLFDLSSGLPFLLTKTAPLFLLFDIIFKDFAKFSRQECASTLSFAVDFGSTSVDCFKGYKAQF